MTLRVITVMPDGEASQFVFARRQVDCLRALGVDIETFLLAGRASPIQLLEQRQHLRRLIAAFKPHVVHTHYGTITAFFAVTATRLPVVITFHGSDLNPVPSISRTRWLAGHLLSQLAAARAARIVCVSEALRRRLWWRRSRSTVIPMGVDLSRFAPIVRDQARKELDWPAADRVVLFNAGVFPRVKRIDLAQAAIACAEGALGTIRFAVMDGRVPPDRVPLHMNAADCLLVTSDYEGSPTVVKEAMACNLPVVTVDAGDVCERLDGVEPSRIVSRDPEQIGRALVDVLTSRQRSNGRAAIAALDAAAVARRMVAEFEAALPRSVRARGVVHADVV